jgi:hypothetical protein
MYNLFQKEEFVVLTNVIMKIQQIDGTQSYRKSINSFIVVNPHLVRYTKGQGATVVA